MMPLMEGLSFRRVAFYALAFYALASYAFFYDQAMVPRHFTLVSIAIVSVCVLVVWFDKWVYRWRFKRDDFRPTFTADQEVTVPVEISPRINAMVMRGGVLTFQQGPDVDEGGGNFHRNIYILIDDVRQDTFRLKWKVMG